MTKHKPSLAERIYGADGPKGSLNSEPTAMEVKLEKYSRSYGPAREKFDAKRKHISPLGGTASPILRSTNPTRKGG